MNSATKISFLKTIRNILVFISKVIFICFCVWYLYNYESYTIVFNIPWIKKMPLIGELFSKIENIGIIIIIIPMAIVITSILYTANKFLNIFSIFLSLSGNIFSVIHTISSGLLEERFKVGFFTVYNTVSQEKKASVFKYFFNEQILDYGNKISDKKAFEIFVNTNVEKNWNYYILSLTDMSVEKVKEFASKSALELHNLYIKQLKALEISIVSSNDGFLYTTKFWVGAGITAFLGLIFYVFYVHNQTINELARENVIQSETQERLLEHSKIESQIAQSSATNINDVNNNIGLANQCIRQLNNDYEALKATVFQHEELLNQLNNGERLFQNISNNQQDIDSIEQVLAVCKGLHHNDEVNKAKLFQNDARIEIRIDNFSQDLGDLTLRIKKLEESYANYNVASLNVTRSITNISELSANAATDRINLETLNYIRQFDPKCFKQEIFDKVEDITIRTANRYLSKLNEQTEIINSKAITDLKAKTNNVMTDFKNQAEQALTTIKSEASTQQNKLSNDVSDIIAKRNNIDSKITNLVNENKQEILNQKFNNDVIAKRQEELAVRIEACYAEHTKVERDLKKDRSFQEYTDSQLYDLNHKITTLENSLGYSNEDLDTQTRRIDTLETTIKIQNDKLGFMQEKLTKALDFIKDLQTMHIGIKEDNSETSNEVD